ncbi:S9 family peptidase [Halorussus gelatinilyticus]|uniref:Acyl-peptide hydrolase n=1 Tax=Halorussus gelatinilyticus TaxID=2937524 RepID=A0A8U0IGM2_9EURY|nr:S9 family peptidase [Halorussus gelatinilyticus]UPV99433.1 S9 family peptidase [Halorussus gelatinilyticus]
MPTYDFERYLNVRSAKYPTFGPDGELAFLMDTTGVPQVWRLDEPGEWPRQLTFEEEAIGFADWSPERDELVFGMDQGGDERTQLFRLDADGETVTPLTDTPEAIHYWGGWNSDGSRFAFASNRRDESVFDVYVQGRDERGDDAEMVYEGDGWLSVSGWSPSDVSGSDATGGSSDASDGDRLALTEMHSSFDYDVYVLDVETGDLNHVTPHEGDVRFQSVYWGPDGDALYLITDEGTDTTYLARLDLDTEEIETVATGDDRAGADESRDPPSEDGNWNVESLTLDEDTGRFVFGTNVDGYTELTAAELTGETDFETFPAPDLPKAVTSGGTFDDDAERFAVTVTGSTENTNVYVVDAASGEAERWTDAATAGLPKESFVEPRLVHYETFDGREIPAFFSVPEDATPGETPVIVDIHGGPESQRRPSFHSVKQYFLNRGYAYLEPNVRGSTGYGTAYTHLDDVRNRMDSVKDVAAAVEWLRDQPEIDPEKVVAFGGSYGGFMVLAALTEYPDLWAAGVDVVGIANFVTFLENTGDWRREHREAEYGSLEEDREFLESISPTTNAENIRAPLLVLHGANDPRVPVGEAEQIVETVAEQGVPVEKLIFEDEGHGFSKLENRIEAYTTVADFLDEHV